MSCDGLRDAQFSLFPELFPEPKISPSLWLAVIMQHLQYNVILILLPRLPLSLIHLIFRQATRWCALETKFPLPQPPPNSHLYRYNTIWIFCSPLSISGTLYQYHRRMGFRHTNRRFLIHNHRNQPSARVSWWYWAQLLQGIQHNIMISLIS